MIVRIGRFEFRGPYESPANLESLPGVFAVISILEGQAELVDVGTAADLRSCVESHDRKQFWRRMGVGSRLVYAASYTPNLDDQGRMQIERELRTQYRIPCGSI